MPTDFNNLAYFGINNVQMNEKCWNRGVTFSSRTIFHFEQCVMQYTRRTPQGQADVKFEIVMLMKENSKKEKNNQT